MQRANAPGGNARTFLTHLFGSGLDGDDRYVVERSRSRPMICSGVYLVS